MKYKLILYIRPAIVYFSKKEDDELFDIFDVYDEGYHYDLKTNLFDFKYVKISKDKNVYKCLRKFNRTFLEFADKIKDLEL